MKINKCLFLLLVISFSYSQIDYSISYEIKFSVDENGFEDNSVNNFENYFDVNLYYKDIYDLLSTEIITTFNNVKYGLYTNKD